MLKIVPLLFGALALVSRAAEDAPPVSPIMREVSSGVYEIGPLRLDQNARTVTFPGHLNLDDGTLEYLIVTPQGNVHESLLVSETPPSDVHFAMLLLGAKGSGRHDGALPPAQIDANYLKTAPPLIGDKVTITVRWKAGAAEKSALVEDWIVNTQTRKPAVRVPWIYNGSLFNDGRFLAQIEGAHAAMVTYPAALINNPRQGNDNDQIWTVNTKAVPAVQTPVDIVITLLPEAHPQSKIP